MHNFSFWVWLQFDLSSFVTICFFYSFVTVWVLEFCHNLVFFKCWQNLKDQIVTKLENSNRANLKYCIGCQCVKLYLFKDVTITTVTFTTVTITTVSINTFSKLDFLSLSVFEFLSLSKFELLTFVTTLLAFFYFFFSFLILFISFLVLSHFHQLVSSSSSQNLFFSSVLF